MKRVLVFHNPHVEIWFKTPVYHHLSKRKSVKKYEYLFDETLRLNGKVHVLIDGFQTSLPSKLFLNKALALIEFRYWCRINNVPLDKVIIHNSAEKLEADHYLLTFLYGTLTSIDRKFKFNIDKYIASLVNTKAKKVVHCTHYMYNADLAAENLAKIKPDFLIAENNLKKNSSFFNEFFNLPDTVKFLTVPFVPGGRFKNLNAERVNKTVATGTIPYPMHDTAFESYFKTNVMHPMRMSIYQRQSELKEILDSFISPMDESNNHPKMIKFLLRVPLLKSVLALKYKSQKNYFSFNIVELYNKYLMFAVPEEINDLPGISFVEGMACGCALVAKEDPMYNDLGMTPGKHYIAYDGSFDGFQSALKDYHNNPEDAAVIGQNGYTFIKENVTPEVVTQKLLKELFA